MIVYSTTYLKMHEIAQNGVTLCTRTLHKQYADFTQLLTLYRVDECVVYTVIDIVWYHPGLMAPLMFASCLLKGMMLLVKEDRSMVFIIQMYN